MVSVKITVKTICALICGRPIVKPEYFDELVKAVEAQKNFPIPESFYPPINEPSIKNEKIDLTICPRRKTVFSGITFVFLTAKQHAKLSPAIKLGGGETKLIKVAEEDAAASLTAPNICVVEIGLSQSQASVSGVERKWNDTITAALERKKYRTISEAEIGLAVIFASTECYCNPQASLGTGVKPASSTSVVQGPSLSQNAVVDETAMPSIIGEITAYVADTEMDQLMDTCMEQTGEKRNKDLRVKDQGKYHPENITTVKETPARTGTVNVRGELPMLRRKPVTDQNSSASPPSKIPGRSRNKETDSQQSNSITNYFQVASKKRKRNEDGEISIAKYVRNEIKPPEGCGHSQPVTRSLCENNPKRFQEEHSAYIDESSYIDTSRKSVTENKKSEKFAAESIPSGQSKSKKRKEMDDSVEDEASLELIFASQELDWEEDVRDLAEQKNAQDPKKKRKMENKEMISTSTEAKGPLQEKEQISPALSQKEETKDEPVESIRSDSNNPGKFADDCNLPSRLLLTEFRSLVVSNPKKDVYCASKKDYGHLNNFKRFKKVAYPGAGQLPHIIGGSDLIAAHSRKDSEMEEWLKQEMEEQTRHEREESLADDLFRYEPRIKRR
ncbi:nibrin isoform X2 [Anolis carolinensis]|nr:PREDICTED: nibrin isoform X2 [Anolis carolinensis]|eukprot:XP_008106619.1 PREDICTED: nibrin isoform X2 [Anolis carolinensis]